MVTFASSFNSSDSRDDYKELFKNYCEIYYPVSTDFQQGPCPMFVELLFYSINKVDPIYHCDDIGACTPTSLLTNDIEIKGDGPFCQVCEQLVTQLRDQLQDERYISLIKKQVKQLCEYLRVVGKEDDCDQLFDKYIDQAILFIKNINPQSYCRSIQLCTPKPQFKAALESKLPSLANFKDFGIETNVEINGKSVKNLNQQKLESPKCMFCKRFVKEMFKFLKENRTEISVRDGLDKICQLIYRPGPRFDQCEHLVATYSRELLEILVDETDPEVICMILEQCTREKIETFELQKPEPISMSQFISLLDPQIEVGSFRSCVECKLFIKFLQGQLEDPETQEDMKAWLLNNLCSNLETSELKKSCSDFVKDKSPAFFDAIVKQLDPTTACIDLGSCRKRAKNIMLVDFLKVFENADSIRQLIASPIAARYTGQVCDQCVDIVTKIDEYLSSHSIDHDVSILIDQVCNKLPNESVKQECVMLVKTFGQEIVQLITTADSPRQLCSKLSLCSA